MAKDELKNEHGGHGQQKAVTAKDTAGAKDALPSSEREGVEVQAAPAPGTAIVGTTTIDTIFTTVYGTRSANLGAATYRWSDFNKIQCNFASGTDLAGQCS